MGVTLKKRRGVMKVSVMWIIGIILLGAALAAVAFNFGNKYMWPQTEKFLQNLGVIGEPKYNEAIVGDVAVHKKVQFSVIDKFAGGAAASATVAVYDENDVQLESLTTDSSGLATTSNAYDTGTTLFLKVTYSGGIRWFKFVVPGMKQADVETATVNGPHTLEMFDLGTYTLKIVDSAGNTYSSGGSLNKTTLGSTIQLVITIYETSDNDGYISSYDPIYDINLNALVIVKITGTNYENVVLTGISNSIEKGSNMFFGKVVPDESITKWKVGNEYRDPYTGVYSVSITLDLSGYSGDAADIVVYLYTFADWDYFVRTGSPGPYSTTSASFTLNLVD